MNVSRRGFLPALLAATSASFAQSPNLNTSEQNPCVGSWFTTRAQTSIILGIEPGGGVLFIFIENGSFNIGRREWKAAPGGIIVNGFPRFRLWASDAAERLRAEMEELPAGIEVSKGFAAFPLRFFMRRAERSTALENIANRPLPAYWEKDTRPQDWDQGAGKMRTVE